jgi:ABC-type bacteriocin/lantibiotic exporter with double-glycine peptidase domain
VPKCLLPVPHRPQLSDGDCLAACAAMALAYWGRDSSYPELMKRLEIRSYGAPARNILHLASAHLQVTYSHSNLAGLERLLADGLPAIVFVRTGELPYWSYGTDHALVVAGYDRRHFYLNDPAYDRPALPVPKGDFELAWLERDYTYALLFAPTPAGAREAGR